MVSSPAHFCVISKWQCKLQQENTRRVQLDQKLGKMNQRGMTEALSRKLKQVRADQKQDRQETLTTLVQQTHTDSGWLRNSKTT